MSAEILYTTGLNELPVNSENVTARVSADTMTAFWQGVATVANSIKADAIEELAAELRRRPALRGVPATVDARELEARAKALRVKPNTAEQ